jgi:glycosidase
MKSKFFQLLMISFLFLQCKDNHTGQDETKQNAAMNMRFPDWAKNAVIYEVNIRQYTKEGTINAFSDHLPRLKEMGVDILWMMPIFPISTTKRKGSLGSYYAVSDFTEVNPEFGTKEDMKNLIEKAHAYGLKIILDWVPNHTGWDHKWIKSNPDFYTRDSTGQITDPLDGSGKSMGWTDVADLNYDNQEMRKAMISDLLYWVNEYKVDGYRMDIAWGVPLDFWQQASDTLVSQSPDIFMLAEADLPEQVNNGYFQACYGWKLHHIMNDIAKGHKNVDSIFHWFHHDRPQIGQGRIMQFTSNHDENSWSGSEFERMGDGAKAFAVLAMTFDGIPLIYSGQEEPLTKRLEFFEKDNISFDKFKNQPFYETLIKVKHQQEAIWNADYGAVAEKIGNSDYVIAYKRQKGASKVVAILNLSSQIKKVTLTQDIEPMWDVYKLEESRPMKAGEVIEMMPWEYRLLQPLGAHEVEK